MSRFNQPTDRKELEKVVMTRFQEDIKAISRKGKGMKDYVWPEWTKWVDYEVGSGFRGEIERFDVLTYIILDREVEVVQYHEEDYS